MQEEESKITSLFKEIQVGSKASFDELFLFYYPKLLAFAKLYLKQPEGAEEVTSELFVKIWIKRDTLSHVLNPEVYLFVSIKNACLNFIRSNRKRKELFSEAVEDSEFHQDHADAMEDKELNRLLNEAIAALPEQRRMVFILIKEQGLKADDVARLLGISKRTVENHLYKAIKTLADNISNYLGFHPQTKVKKQLHAQLPIMFLFLLIG